MKKGREDFSTGGLFTMSRLGPKELTHAVLEEYISKGRYLHSAFICDLCIRFWRLLRSALVRTVGRFGSVLTSMQMALAKRRHGFSSEWNDSVDGRCGQGPWDASRFCD